MVPEFKISNKMHNWYNKLFQSRTKYFIVFFIVILYILTLIKVSLRTDDDYIGEQVYWLQKTGHVKSELMRGYNNIGIENYQSVFHKLFIFQGELFTKAFGWSLNTLHLISILYTFIFFAILYFYLKKKQYLFSKGTFPLILVLMLSFSNFSEYSASFRPEVMLMTLGFISYIFIDRFLQEKKYIWLVLSAIFAGAAFLTHLNGFIFIAAGGLLLLYKKEFPAAIIFGIISSLVFSLYFVDILTNSSFSYFLYQFRHDPSLSDDNFYWWTPFMRLISEHRRFFNSPKEIFMTILLITSLFYLKKLKKYEKHLLVYTLILVITLAIYSYSKTSKYLILYLPFLSLIIASGWQSIEKNEDRNHTFIKSSFRTVIILYFVLGVFYTSTRIYKYSQQPALIDQNAKIASSIQSRHQNINLIAPPSFIFNEIDSFHRIMNIQRFNFFIESHGKPPINFSQLIDSSKKYNIQYIILDPPNSSYFKIDKICKYNPKYQIKKEENNYYLVKINTSAPKMLGQNLENKSGKIKFRKYYKN